MLKTDLTEISQKLSPIEISSTLNNLNLINTINSMFLTAGSNLVYLTDEETDGQIYFEDYKIVAAYWDDLSGLEALKVILTLDYAGVEIVKGKQQFDHNLSLSLNDFFNLSKPDELHTVKDHETGEFHKSHLINLSFIKGFLTLKDNMIVSLEYLIPDAVPIEYLRSLVSDASNFKGVFCKISQLQGKQSYYVMNYDEMIWIFHIKKNAERAKLHEILTTTLKKVVRHE